MPYKNSEEFKDGSLNLLTLEKLKIHDRLDGMQKAIEALVDAVKKQNGRVDRLEQWRAYLLGMGTVIVVILVPILMMLFQKFIKGL